MSIITAFEFDGQVIRSTEDGRYSVYDVIKFCGCKSEHQVWKRLSAQYPEIGRKTEYFNFPGRGQRGTPVASYQDCMTILQILGKHPGQLEITSDKFYPRTETQIVSVLKAAFADLQPMPQFCIHGYRIDLYLATANIVIEIDEYGHKDYDTQKELVREQKIKDALGCSFIRFDPYLPGFNLGDVILSIRELI